MPIHYFLVIFRLQKVHKSFFNALMTWEAIALDNFQPS